MSQRLILGSGSPRRKEILGYFGYPFEQMSSSFPEETVLFKGDPAAYTLELAQCKAEALVPQFPQDIVLTADTTVYHTGKIYGKPVDSDDAMRMLTELSGDWHSVFTGVAVYQGDRQASAVEETRIQFNSLTRAQMQRYYQAVGGQDKAGGYAIQQTGSLIVKKMEGCYYNVMGLPVNSVCRLLREFGIDLWEYLA